MYKFLRGNTADETHTKKWDGICVEKHQHALIHFVMNLALRPHLQGWLLNRVHSYLSCLTRNMRNLNEVLEFKIKMPLEFKIKTWFGIQKPKTVLAEAFTCVKNRSRWMEQKMPLYLWPNITLMVLVTSHNLSRHDIRLTIAMRSSGAGMRTRDVERKIRTIVLWMRSQCNVIRYR